MNKQEFLGRLRAGLCGLPQEDVEERVTFYNEMIEDRIEEGLSEDDAVKAVGSVDEIISQTVFDLSPVKTSNESSKEKKTMNAWTVVLLILGAPLWLSLIITAFAVVLSVYVTVWSVIVSLWAVFASFLGCSFGGFVSGAVFAFSGNSPAGIAMAGAGIILAGLSIFVFFGCRAATKGVAIFTKSFFLWIKSLFIKKEEA